MSVNSKGTGSGNQTHKIPVLDILGLGTYQTYCGNEGEMSMNGTRATLLFEATDRFYEIATKFNQNAPVNVLDFLNFQRQLKAQMLAMKSQFIRENRGNT